MKTLKMIIASMCVLFSLNSAKAQVPDTTGRTTVIVAPVTPVEIKEEEQVGFHLGLRVQPTFSSFDVTTENGNTVRSNFTGGIGYGGSLNYYISNYVGLHLEGMYSTLAQQYRDSTADRRVTLSYLNFPLLISFNTNYGKAVNLNLAFGPQVGISTGAKVETTETNGGVATGEAIIRVKPMDLGVAYGAGLDFGLGEERNVHFNIGYRGVYGLVDISDNKIDVGDGQYYVLQKSRVKTHGVYLGFMFKL